MRKIILVTCIMLVILCQSAYSYDPRRFQYELEELQPKYEEYIPTSWIDDKLEIEYLNRDSKQEFIILHIREADTKQPDKYATLNQIIVLTWQDANLEKVWQSEVFVGSVGEITFEDADNNGTANINVRVGVKNEAGSFYSLLSFDWANMYATLVIASKQNNILGNVLSLGDYDEDQLIEIYTENPLTDPQYKSKRDLYRFSNNRLEHCKTIYILHKNKNTDNSALNSFDALFLPIVSQFPNTKLEEVFWLNDLLYCIRARTSNETSSYARYFIAKEVSEGQMEFCYELPAKYHQLSFLEYESGDLNADGVYDIIFADLKQGYVPYYIVSVSDERCELISPTDENFQSLVFFIYNYGHMIPKDIDGDGIREIYSDIEYKEKEVQLYWKWETITKKYVKYKVGYYDFETMKIFYEDFKEDKCN